MTLYEFRLGLENGLSENNFTYYGDGLIEVKSFTEAYLATGNYKLTVFKVEELNGIRRHLMIWFSDIETRTYYFDLVIYDSFRGFRRSC